MSCVRRALSAAILTSSEPKVTEANDNIVPAAPSAVGFRLCKSVWLIQTDGMSDGLNVQAIKRKLDHLRNSRRLQSYRAELLKPWPGMVYDIRSVAEEMALELRRNGTASPFLKDVQFDGDHVKYRLPDWVTAARGRFSELYDAPEDEVRYQKALTVFQERLFLQIEGTSDSVLEDLGSILDGMFEQEEMPAGTA
jgi:hypothetical protein